MLKKLLVGLFILGMMCGAGFISADPYSTAQVNLTGNTPSFSKVICGGGNC